MMTVRALMRAILLAVLVAATCSRAEEITGDYSAADATDRPESAEDEVTPETMYRTINNNVIPPVERALFMLLSRVNYSRRSPMGVSVGNRLSLTSHDGGRLQWPDPAVTSGRIIVLL